uniref:Zinc finger, C2HC-type containing 1A n=1 Tax=Gouania willdenowi TaxID=441366 RepID=A0A8C5D653_GOUWI
MEEFEDGAAPPLWIWFNVTLAKDDFSPQVWEKHTIICQKVTAKKRKVFDSRRQRLRGTEISVLKPTKTKGQISQKVMSKNHKNLNFTIRAAKTVTAAMKDEKPLPPPPPPTNDPDYIQCPYCQRRFNESAADRHNKIYKEQHAQMPNKGKPGEAKNLAGSTTYKPPAATKKTNTPMISRIPIAVFRIPQRSSIRPQSGIPNPKASSAGSMRSAGLTSPPSGAANKPQVMKRFSTPASREQEENEISALKPTKPKAEPPKKPSNWRKNHISSNNSNIANNISKYCHLCGTRYLVQLAKFCCKYGMRRM